MLNPVTLAQKLVQIPSENPPGNEHLVSEFMTDLLKQSGFAVETFEMSPGRSSIVAKIIGIKPAKPLVFTGHFDVVPVGEMDWEFDPFCGEISDGKLLGRGSVDMKSGIAAFVTAAMSILDQGRRLSRGVTLVLTVGEETGCEGAFHLAQSGVLGVAHLLVVAEPTSNLPVLAHKGSLRLKICVSGRSAHSSMPNLGENAVMKMADVVSRLGKINVETKPDPLLGNATLAITQARSGKSINTIPDLGEVFVDIRTLPVQEHVHIVESIQNSLGPDAHIETLTSFPGVYTAIDHPLIVDFSQEFEKEFGTAPEFKGAPYFTDASALCAALDNAPTVIIGPGDPKMCHKTNEACKIEDIISANGFYARLIQRYCTN